jgi:hypothetical protein
MKSHPVTHLVCKDKYYENWREKWESETISALFTSTIRHLDITNSILGEDGGNVIAEAIKESTSLTHLNLGCKYARVMDELLTTITIREFPSYICAKNIGLDTQSQHPHFNAQPFK